MKKGVPLSQSIKVGSGPWVADRPVFIMELVLSRGGVVVPISTVLSTYLKGLHLVHSLYATFGSRPRVVFPECT